MDGVNLAVQAAAAYRITRLIQEDQLQPFPWLRTLMSRALVKRSQKAEASVSDLVAAELTYMVNCPWCLGFWVSAAVLLADAIVPRLWRPLAAALALSAAVGLARTKLD
jgi:uncharacterized membrane protein